MLEGLLEGIKTLNIQLVSPKFRGNWELYRGGLEVLRWHLGVNIIACQTGLVIPLSRRAKRAPHLNGCL
jgi:hypothetical protein